MAFPVTEQPTSPDETFVLFFHTNSLTSRIPKDATPLMYGQVFLLPIVMHQQFYGPIPFRNRAKALKFVSQPAGANMELISIY